MPVPNSFANVTTSIPLSQLDANFNTPITLGNTAIQLGNTVTTLNNMTLANVTISSGNVTITNVSVTTANVTTANIATAQIANVTVSGTGTFAAGSNTAPSITTSGDTNTGVFFPAADTVAIGTGGTERVRVVSAGDVGVGTSTPATISSRTVLSINNASNGGALNLLVNGTETLRLLTDNSSFGYVYNIANQPLLFGTNNTERMRIDSSGNLGLGVTPSAWATASGQKAFQIGTSGFALSSSGAGAGDGSLTWNGYYNGTNWIYSYTGGAASRFRLNESGAAWFTAASGTAGNAITFTQAMTLDASGRLVIGHTAAQSTGQAYPIQVKAVGSGAGGYGILNSSNVISGGISLGSSADNSLVITADPDNLASSSYIGMNVDGTERARITSDGVFMVGTTGLSANGTACSFSGSSRVVRIYGTTQADGAFMVDKSTNVSTTAQVFIQFSINAQATGNGQINANGANAAAFGTFSDRRLKENIVDLPPQLDNILALRPVEFDYIESEGGGHQLGFIAQEVQEVYPDLVGERSDGMLTLSDMNKNDARLIKAFQELAAKVQALEAEVQALKGNA